MKAKSLFIIIRGSVECAKAAFEFAKGWPLLRDHEAQLVNAEQFATLVAADEITNESYWRVEKDNHGIVLLSRALEYRNTVDDLRKGISDFISGFNTCEELLKKR